MTRIPMDDLVRNIAASARWTTTFVVSSTCSSARKLNRSGANGRPLRSAFPRTAPNSTSTGSRMQGLLDAEYVRLSGRSGPGAGRPAKVYRRRTEEVSVSLPGREYALAGELMATAIDEAADQGTPVTEALARAARSGGSGWDWAPVASALLSRSPPRH